jgi:hypothetical protein
MASLSVVAKGRVGTPLADDYGDSMIGTTVEKTPFRRAFRSFSPPSAG